MARAVGIVGAGMAGAVAALELAERGCRVVLFDAADQPLTGASWVNEGKSHLGYVYGGDPTGHTLRRMIDGALEFGPVLRRWLGTEVVARAVMQPFDYAVPDSSQLPPEAVEAHFDRVQAYLAARLARTGGEYLGQRRPEPWRRLDDHGYGSDGCRVMAAYRTPERAVDTRILGTALRAVLRAHPGIELRLTTRVQRLRPDGAVLAQCALRDAAERQQVLEPSLARLLVEDPKVAPGYVTAATREVWPEDAREDLRARFTAAVARGVRRYAPLSAVSGR